MRKALRVSLSRLAVVACLGWGVAAALGCGAEEPVEQGAAGVVLSGAVQKGPFVLGSTVSVSPVDSKGNPLGQVFNTQTSNDLGEFNVEMDALGPVFLEGTGFYYNELTGALSGAPITLRAYHVLESSGMQHAFLNLVTHLSHGRVRALLRQGATVPDAVRQAEEELVEALGIGPLGYRPAARGTDMNVLGGDSDENAYLLALSAILLQAAANRGGPIDASLQEIVNTAAQDLEDGDLGQDLRAEVMEAQRNVDGDAVMAMLRSRLESLGSQADVPDIHRMLDNDLDGIMNAFDNCPRSPNPDQTDLDGNGKGDVCECGNGTVDPDEECDDGNDDDTDGCTSACRLPACGDGIVQPQSGEECDDGNANDDECTSLCRRPACGDGIVQPSRGEECEIALDPTCRRDCTRSTCGNASFEPWEICVGASSVEIAAPAPISRLAKGDFNGDGRVDIVTAHSDARTIAFFRNSGSGLAAPVRFDMEALPVDLAVGDVNGDGFDDVVVAQQGAQSVALYLGGPTGLAPAATVPLPKAANAVALVDVTDDGTLDIVAISVGSGAMPSSILCAAGNGTGGFGAGQTAQLTLVMVTNKLRLVAADIVRDGRVDLVLSQPESPEPPLVLVNRGNCVFEGLRPPFKFEPMASFAVGDVNHDGALDVLSLGSGPEGARAYLGDGTGAFEEVGLQLDEPYWPSAPFGLALGDFNADGHPDIAGSRGPAILLGMGDGQSFSVPEDVFGGRWPTDAPGEILAADMDGNCTDDLVYVDMNAPDRIKMIATNSAEGSCCGHPARLAVIDRFMAPAAVGESYDEHLVAYGGVPPYSWTITGLPQGFSADDAGRVVGVPSEAGEFDVDVKVTDSQGRSDGAVFRLAVAASGLAITTTSLPAGQLDAGYSATLTASGGRPPYSWSGTASRYLVIDQNGTVRGSVFDWGIQTMAVRVRDADGRIAEKSLPVEFIPPWPIVTAPLVRRGEWGTLPPATVGQAYSFAYQAAYGTPPYTWEGACGGGLVGLTVDSSGVLSGTCAQKGTHDCWVRVRDAAGNGRPESWLLRLTCE